MPAAVDGGPKIFEGMRDEEGHREYTVTYNIKMTGASWGPAAAMTASGLPTPGSYWNMTRSGVVMGGEQDIDVYAWCTDYLRVYLAPKTKEGTNSKLWCADLKFSTRGGTRCRTTTIQDPLLEPAKISGSFVKYTIEATQDRFGQLLKSSSHEMLKGPLVEFDANRPTVRIEQNVGDLQLDLLSQMVDHVNDATLWGLGERKIKLSNAWWERKLYGVCNFYFTRGFEFDIDFNTFDRYVPDEGTKVLAGDWRDEEGGTGTVGSDAWQLRLINGDIPDKNNPTHFNRFKDRNGENIRALLDGNGLPANTHIIPGTGLASVGTASGDVYMHHVEYYPEANFLLLQIPTSFIGFGTGTAEA